MVKTLKIFFLACGLPALVSLPGRFDKGLAIKVVDCVPRENKIFTLGRVIGALQATGTWDSEEALPYVRSNIPFPRDLVTLASTARPEATSYLSSLSVWRFPDRRFRNINDCKVMKNCQ